MDPDATARRRPSRPTPRQLGLLAGAFVLGGVLAIVVDRALEDSGPMRAQETVAEAPIGTLEETPEPPVVVSAERVRLPEGFVSRRFHGGPAFVFVDAGRVGVELDGQTTEYGPGAFFFVPGGRVYTLSVLDTALLSTVRLLEPGAEATTEVG